MKQGIDIVDCWGAGTRLCLHHFKYDKKKCSPKNLITLCNSCNIRANFNRDYWQKLYQSIMDEKYEQKRNQTQNITRTVGEVNFS